MLRFRLGSRAPTSLVHSLVLGAWLFSTTTHAQFQADSAAARVVRALQGTGRAVRTGQQDEPGWTWQEYKLYDQEISLTVDLVGSNQVLARKVIYFLPGGGTNFRSSFFTPVAHNLAHFFNEQGYLVIGITPREHNLPITLPDYAFTAAWGMAQHRDDVRAIVELVNAAVSLPYEMLGHSYGASTALDYASTFPLEMERLIALDIYSIDPEVDPEGARAAESTYAAHVELLANGTYVDDGGAGARLIANAPREWMLLDSGISREPYGASGNFTLEGYFFFAMIETARLPGVHTPLTGLENDWPLQRGVFSGTYMLSTDPRADQYALAHVDRSTVDASASTTGSGMTPLALARDYWAVIVGNGAYTLDWSAIRSKLIWINSELGYGAQQYGAKLIQAGNPDVSTDVIAGYGHGDLLMGRDADRDVWDKLR